MATRDRNDDFSARYGSSERDQNTGDGSRNHRFSELSSDRQRYGIADEKSGGSYGRYYGRSQSQQGFHGEDESSRRYSTGGQIGTRDWSRPSGYGSESRYGADNFGGSPYENDYHQASRGSSEYGANFRDSSSLGRGEARFGAPDTRYGPDNRYESERHYGADGLYGADSRYSSENGYGRDSSRYNSQSNDWHASGHASTGRDRDPGRNRYDARGPGERSWEHRDYGRPVRRNAGTPPDYQSFGSSQQGNAWAGQYGANDHRVNMSAWEDERYSNHEPSMMEKVSEKVGKFFGVGPKGYKRSDARIQEDVNDALMDDAYVDATAIEVKVQDAEVTLEGFVEERQTKRRAEDIAASIRGVKDVHNHLRTQPLSGRSTVASSIGTAEAVGTQSQSPTAGTDKKDRARTNSVS